MKGILRKLGTCSIVAMLLAPLVVEVAHSQQETEWLTDWPQEAAYIKVGRVWTASAPDGGRRWEREIAWPGGRQSQMSGTEKWGSSFRSKRHHFSANNFTDANGDFHDFYYGYVWSGSTFLLFHHAQRFPPPRILVGGADIIPDWGQENFELSNGRVDPNLLAERAIYTKWRYTRIGVDIDRWEYGYSTPPDWDYVLADHIFTNTGVLEKGIGPNNGEGPQPNWHDLEGFWFAYATLRPQISRYAHSRGIAVYDDIAKFIEPWGPGNGVVYLVYDDDQPGGFTDVGDPGTTVFDDAYVLASASYVSQGPIHVDMAYNDPTRDPNQANCTFLINDRDYGAYLPDFSAIFTDTGYDCPLETANRDIDASVGIPSGIVGIGPKDIPKGEDINVVWGWAASGISWEEQYRLGKEIMERRNSGGDMTSEEVALVQTGRDSLEKVLNRAFWNVEGVYPDGSNPKPAGKEPYDVPDPPPPPQYFSIRPDGPTVVLEWTREPESAPDFDSGTNDFAGYRIYRTSGIIDSLYHAIVEGPAASFTSVTITTPEGDTKEGLKYVDDKVAVGISYYYYIVAYDDGSQNWADPGVSLESGKFYTWQGWGETPVVPLAGPGTDIDGIVVVPNPYSSAAHTYPGEPDKIIFKHLPGQAVISIYTSAGDLVKIINHTNGSGDEAWNLRTDFNQYLKSDVYIFTVDSKSENLPGSFVGKFVVIR